MKRAISITVWRSLGAALVGLVTGYGLATYRQAYQEKEALDVEKLIQAGPLVHYERTFTNASGFRTELRETPNLDTLFAQKPFLAKCIRILWQDSVELEAISVPPPGASDHFYLIRGDSITQLRLSPRKAR